MESHKGAQKIPPIRRADNSWVRSDKKKVDKFAEHLENTFQPPPRQSPAECTRFRTKDDKLQIQLVTLQELKDEISDNLNAKKAPGSDLITA